MLASFGGGLGLRYIGHLRGPTRRYPSRAGAVPFLSGLVAGGRLGGITDKRNMATGHPEGASLV